METMLNELKKLHNIETMLNYPNETPQHRDKAKWAKIHFTIETMLNELKETS